MEHNTMFHINLRGGHKKVKIEHELVCVRTENLVKSFKWRALNMNLLSFNLCELNFEPILVNLNNTACNPASRMPKKFVTASQLSSLNMNSGKPQHINMADNCLHVCVQTLVSCLNHSRCICWNSESIVKRFMKSNAAIICYAVSAILIYGQICLCIIHVKDIFWTKKIIN